MAYDLIFGTTTRDWSCGQLPPASAPASRSFEATANMDPSALAEAVRHEIATTTSMALRLRKTKHIPDSAYHAYRKFHSAWNDYWDFHKGRFHTQDNLNLWNLRELNKQFAGRFKILDDLAKTPLKRPAAPGTPQETTTDISLPFRPAGSVAEAVGHPWAVLLGAGLAIGALTWFGGQKKYRTV